MPAKRKPSYLLHKPTGQARVRIQGKDIYSRRVQFARISRALRGLGGGVVRQVGRRFSLRVVFHEDHFSGTGEMHVHQIADALRPILTRPVVGHLDMPPAAQRLTHHQQVARPAALVFVIHFRRLAGFGRKRRARFVDPLFALFVQADHGAFRIEGPCVDFQHVLPPPHEFGVGLGGHTPKSSPRRVEGRFLTPS